MSNRAVQHGSLEGQGQHSLASVNSYSHSNFCCWLHNSWWIQRFLGILLNKLPFQAFVICDTIAMYSAILVTVTLIWAQLGDITLVINSLRLAVSLLGISLTMMSLAFMAAVYVVMSKLVWLSYVVLILGLISLACLLTLFIPG